MPVVVQLDVCLRSLEHLRFWSVGKIKQINTKSWKTSSKCHCIFTYSVTSKNTISFFSSFSPDFLFSWKSLKGSFVKEYGRISDFERLKNITKSDLASSRFQLAPFEIFCSFPPFEPLPLKKLCKKQPLFLFCGRIAILYLAPGCQKKKWDKERCV